MGKLGDFCALTLKEELQLDGFGWSWGWLYLCGRTSWWTHSWHASCRNHLVKGDLPFQYWWVGGSTEESSLSIGVPSREPKGSMSNATGGNQIHRVMCYGKVREELRHLQSALLAESPTYPFGTPTSWPAILCWSVGRTLIIESKSRANPTEMFVSKACDHEVLLLKIPPSLPREVGHGPHHGPKKNYARPPRAKLKEDESTHCKFWIIFLIDRKLRETWSWSLGFRAPWSPNITRKLEVCWWCQWAQLNALLLKWVIQLNAVCPFLSVKQMRGPTAKQGLEEQLLAEDTRKFKGIWKWEQGLEQAFRYY